LKTVEFLVGSLSLKTALAVGRQLGTFAFSVVRFRRNEVQRRIATCFPEFSAERVRGVAREMYRNLGMTGIEVFWYGRHGTDALGTNVVIEGEENLTKAIEQGHGVQICTAHTGNWELLGFFARCADYKVTAVVKELSNKKANAYWLENRRRLGLDLLPAKNSLRACLRVLKDKGLLAHIVDQNMRHGRGIFVDFFGVQACTTPGPALLAARTGAPMVPVLMVRKHNERHVVHMLPAIPPPPDRSETSLHRVTQQYTSVVEAFVREHPEQWLWLHRRWKTRPLQESAPPSL
jgi:KDO2-lipid IV(A) lauroyltransferase